MQNCRASEVILSEDEMRELQRATDANEVAGERYPEMLQGRLDW